MSQVILIVDDDEDVRSVIELLLHNEGYEVFTLKSGEEAIMWLDDNKIDLLLLDLNMPVLNGFEVFKRLHKKKHTSEIPVIFLTASEDFERVVEGLDLGAVDYIKKTASSDELIARIKAQLRIKSLVDDLRKLNGKLALLNTENLAELRAAAIVQEALLPIAPLIVGDISIAGKLLPCTEVSGDLFNYFFIDDEHLAVYILDVSGHGIASAMVTVALSQDLKVGENGNLVNLYTRHIESPREVLRKINSLYPDNRFGKYLTAVYMVLNVKTGVLEYCVAGHPPPLIYRGNGDVIPLAVGGPLIGYYPDYEFQSARHSLEPGDFIILYTDGLIEAQNKEGETFGEDRLLFSIRKYANQPNEVLINSIIDDVCSFKEHDPFIDDVTVIAIKYA